MQLGNLNLFPALHYYRNNSAYRSYKTTNNSSFLNLAELYSIDIPTNM